MTAMIASAWSARPEAMTVRQPTIIARPSPLSATTPTIMIPTSNRSSTSSSHASTRQAPKPRPDYRCQPLAPFTLGEGARPRPIAYPDQNTGVMPSICGRRLNCTRNATIAASRWFSRVFSICTGEYLGTLGAGASHRPQKQVLPQRDLRPEVNRLPVACEEEARFGFNHQPDPVQVEIAITPLDGDMNAFYTPLQNS